MELSWQSACPDSKRCNPSTRELEKGNHKFKTILVTKFENRPVRPNFTKRNQSSLSCELHVVINSKRFNHYPLSLAERGQGGGPPLIIHDQHDYPYFLFPIKSHSCHTVHCTVAVLVHDPEAVSSDARTPCGQPGAARPPDACQGSSFCST